MKSFVTGGITAPSGFRTAAVACGLKTKSLDLALVVADEPSSTAAVFTTNLALAAPVIVSKKHLKESNGIAQAIAVNSGCANACTGETGLVSAHKMAESVAQATSCQLSHALIASTGVIGVPLDITKVHDGIVAASHQLNKNMHLKAAEAIMTTDLSPKERAIKLDTPSGSVVIGGMVKGAGMIEPNMATMLGFLTTDVTIEPHLLQRALLDAVGNTFNAISVDGECSTNDSVFLMASGASDIKIDENLLPLFTDGLRDLCGSLARDIVRGGEGATKLVTILVSGSRSSEEANRAAHAVANSLLVKTALNGGDPNWGRLVAVAGRAGVEFNLSRAKVRIGQALLLANNTVYPDQESIAADHLAEKEVEIEVNLGTDSQYSATVWTCDLSDQYVRINADYRT
tara:strand:+ start:29321 stop:30523 length:1203 start_codon:yes stop_codon:yes gene_type:complete